MAGFQTFASFGSSILPGTPNFEAVTRRTDQPAENPQARHVWPRRRGTAPRPNDAASSSNSHGAPRVKQTPGMGQARDLVRLLPYFQCKGENFEGKESRRVSQGSDGLD